MSNVCILPALKLYLKFYCKITTNSPWSLRFNRETPGLNVSVFMCVINYTFKAKKMLLILDMTPCVKFTIESSQGLRKNKGKSKTIYWLWNNIVTCGRDIRTQEPFCVFDLENTIGHGSPTTKNKYRPLPKYPPDYLTQMCTLSLSLRSSQRPPPSLRLSAHIKETIWLSLKPRPCHQQLFDAGNWNSIILQLRNPSRNVKWNKD